MTTAFENTMHAHSILNGFLDDPDEATLSILRFCVKRLCEELGYEWHPLYPRTPEEEGDLLVLRVETVVNDWLNSDSRVYSLLALHYLDTFMTIFDDIAVKHEDDGDSVS